jgi:DNA-binding transcriptional LysR family regulator
MADFMRANPLVQATCSVTSRSQVLRLLEKGSVDFAFTSSIREFNQYTEFKKFLSDPVLLIVHPDHPWAGRGKIQLEDLRSERYIMREDTSGTYEVTRNTLAQEGFNIHDLQVILTLGNSEAIAMAVMQKIGVGFISQSVVQNLVCGRVIPIQIEGINITQEIYFCRNKLHAMGNAQSKFWSFILSQAETSQPG